MEAEVIAEKAPEVKQEEVKTEVKVEAPKEDLISRVSKVKVEPQKAQEPKNEFGLTKEDYEKVTTDPVLSKFYKSMQADYIKKTQAASEERKKAEEIMKQSQTWTPERLQQEINKPDFIQAAQQVAKFSNPPDSGLSNEEYSALTDKEKAQLHDMRQQVNSLQMQNWQMQQKQQDEQLKTRYANYAPDIVDTTITKLVRGEVKADRETVWKALDYDDAVQRAYHLGLQDRAVQLNEKQQSVSLEGFSATPQNEVPKPEAGESNTNYFRRLAQRRMAESKGNNR